MVIICKELNKEFQSKEELFKELKANKEVIIQQKKSQILKSCDKGLSVAYQQMSPAFKTAVEKSLVLDDDFFYIAVNSTNFLDSHSDLHVKGIWNKTVSEQQGKNYLVADHKMELANVIAKKDDIEMFLVEVPFTALGKNYQTQTQVLVYKVRKDKINPAFKEWLDSKNDIEASVRMQYVKVELAMNSNARGDEKELKTYQEYIDKIANRDEFENIDYFWVVKEAKNVSESSLVLAGSNSATGVLNSEPLKNTHSENKNSVEEPLNNTQDKGNQFYNFI